MPDSSFLDWPFFEDHHRDLAARLDAWCAGHLPVDHTDTDSACIALAQALGHAGFLEPSGGKLDIRTLALTRETLARHDGLADFVFAMQGLGMGPVSLFGSAEQRKWLDKTRKGEAISAFMEGRPADFSRF